MTNPEALALPLGVRRLPDAEHVACAHCGAVVGPDAPRVVLHVTGQVWELGIAKANGEATFGLCPACADLDARAAAVLAEHPGIVRGIGSPSIARHRLVSAFHGLAVMGATPAEHYTADGLASLLDRLAVPGVAASWSRQFAPVRAAEAIPGTAAAEPWLHVAVELRAEIRRQYGDHLADRMPPIEHRCPTRGCAWCGVGAVTAKRTAKPWTPHEMRPGGLGGNGPRALAVHLCPACERHHAAGENMHAALLDVADPGRAIRRHRPYDPELRHVRGWAVANRSKPNREPWEHAGLDDLRALLASGEW